MSRSVVRLGALAWLHGLAAALLSRADESAAAWFAGIVSALLSMCCLGALMQWMETGGAERERAERHRKQLEEAHAERDQWVERYVELERKQANPHREP